jgi:hypothetical protein
MCSKKSVLGHCTGSTPASFSLSPRLSTTTSVHAACLPKQEEEGEEKEAEEEVEEDRPILQVARFVDDRY